MNEVKKFLRLRTLLALAALVAAVVLLAAAQGIGQSAPNTTPSEPSVGVASESDDDRVTPAQDFWAVVNPDGTLARDRGAVSSQRFSPGQYEVIFFRNVRNCAYVATIGLSGSGPDVSEPGETTVVGRFENRRGVFVTTHDSTGGTGAFADRGFHLQVSC